MAGEGELGKEGAYQATSAGAERGQQAGLPQHSPGGKAGGVRRRGRARGGCRPLGPGPDRSLCSTAKRGARKRPSLEQQVGSREKAGIRNRTSSPSGSAGWAGGGDGGGGCHEARAPGDRAAAPSSRGSS